MSFLALPPLYEARTLQGIVAAEQLRDADPARFAAALLEFLPAQGATKASEILVGAYLTTSTFCALNAVCLCRRHPWLGALAALELSQVIVGELEKSTSPQVVHFLEIPDARAIVPLDEMLGLASSLRRALCGENTTGMVSTLADEGEQSDSEGDLSPVIV